MSQQTANPPGFTDYMNKSSASLEDAIKNATLEVWILSRRSGIERGP